MGSLIYYLMSSEPVIDTVIVAKVRAEFGIICVGVFVLVQIKPTSFLTMSFKPSTRGLLSCCSFSTVSVRADEL